MYICVVGIGYVGLVTSACFAELGLNVICVDNNINKIQGLMIGKIPIYEPGLEELIIKNSREGRLIFTTDLNIGVSKALVIFIAVGTPQGVDGSADLQYIWSVSGAIGRSMKGYKVIVTKSTVPVGTGQKIYSIIRKNQNKLVNFDIVSNPEFLREGSAIEDFMRPNRIIIGAESHRAKDIMRDLYVPLYLIETPFVITSVESAEMIKYASNAFLATKISFINEMANICERVGADINVVARGMGLDKRIGSKFLHAGPGFGGSCFPKDTEAIVKIAKDNGYHFRIVEAVIEVNRLQPQIMISKIKSAVGGLVARKILTVLGITFKPNTSDMRKAPSLIILPSLASEGAIIHIFDPAGMAEAKFLLNDNFFYFSDTYEAIEGADIIIILTEWNQFRNLDWTLIKRNMRGKVIIDLRNIYNPQRVRDKGFIYISIGRI